MKKCRKCKELKPFESLVKNKNCKDGYDNLCKDCKNKAERERYVSTRQPITDGTIKCRRCGVVKPVTEFNVERKSKDGRRKTCKQCDNERIRSRRKANKKDRTESYWNRRAESLNWTANKDKKTGITGIELKSLYEHSNGNCYYCKTHVGEDFQFDHKESLNKNGQHSIENLAVTCSACNRLKYNMNEKEFKDFVIKYAKRFVAKC